MLEFDIYNDIENLNNNKIELQEYNPINEGIYNEKGEIDISKIEKIEEKEKKENKYHCFLCNYSCKYDSLWINHINTKKHKTRENHIKINKKKYICPICNYSLTKYSEYYIHNLEYHNKIDENISKYKYYCEYCDYGSFSLKLYRKHCKTMKHIRGNKKI